MAEIWSSNPGPAKPYAALQMASNERFGLTYVHTRVVVNTSLKLFFSLFTAAF